MIYVISPDGSDVHQINQSVISRGTPADPDVLPTGYLVVNTPIQGMRNSFTRFYKICETGNKFPYEKFKHVCVPLLIHELTTVQKTALMLLSISVTEST